MNRLFGLPLVPALALVVAMMAMPPAAAQNSPGDECIIQITLHDRLTAASVAYDLLFDDRQWENLTSNVDSDGDGTVTTAEVAAYELRSWQNVSGRDVPDHRIVNLFAEFNQGAYSGDAAADLVAAENRTKLVNFEGPVTQRAGKIVRETWTYWFTDPIRDYGEDWNVAQHARSISLHWGPAATPNPDGGVSVIETVVATAPAEWSVATAEGPQQTHTFASGTAYIVTFVPNDPPRESNGFFSPGISPVILAAGLIGLVLAKQWLPGRRS